MLSRMDHGALLAGMAAAAVAAGCFDGAVILQAREAREVDPDHGLRLSLLARLARRRLWLLGTAVAVLGWPLQLLALSLAPVTVVQPMLAVGLLLLLGVGSRVLGERVGAREWAAATAVIAGVVLLGVAGPEHTDRTPGFAALGATAAVLLCLVAWPYARRARPGPWALILGAGSAFALSALTSKLLTVELTRGRALAALGWALATAACAGVGFLTDMTALQRFDATRVAPPMFVLEMALPVALAPLLFDERWGATPGGGAVLVVGLLLVLCGGGVLGASRPVASADPPAPQPPGSASTRSAALGSSP